MDAIQKLLESTGLSPDELIRQLSEYKAISGSQQKQSVESKDENKNDTHTNGTSSNINDLDDTNTSDISDTYKSGVRTECANVSSTSKPRTEFLNSDSNSVNTSDLQIDLCNTSSSSSSENNVKILHSVTNDVEPSEVSSTCELKTTNTAEVLCNSKIELVVHNQYIKSKVDSELTENSNCNGGIEDLKHKEFDAENSNSEQVSSCENESTIDKAFSFDHDFDQRSSSSEEFNTSDRLEICEELSFDEELQISEEQELSYDGSIRSAKLTRAEELSINDNSGGTPTNEKNVNDGFLIIEESKSNEGLLTTKEYSQYQVLSTTEKLKSDEELSSTVEFNFDERVQLVPDKVLVSIPKELKKSVWGLPVHEELQTVRRLSTDKESKCEELSIQNNNKSLWRLSTGEVLKSKEQLPKTKEVQYIWRFANKKDSKSDEVPLNQELKCDDKLATNEEFKSDQFCLVGDDGCFVNNDLSMHKDITTDNVNNNEMQILSINEGASFVVNSNENYDIPINENSECNGSLSTHNEGIPDEVNSNSVEELIIEDTKTIGRSLELTTVSKCDEAIIEICDETRGEYKKSSFNEVLSIIEEYNKGLFATTKVISAINQDTNFDQRLTNNKDLQHSELLLMTEDSNNSEILSMYPNIRKYICEDEETTTHENTTTVEKSNNQDNEKQNDVFSEKLHENADNCEILDLTMEDDDCMDDSLNEDLDYVEGEDLIEIKEESMDDLPFNEVTVYTENDEDVKNYEEIAEFSEDIGDSCYSLETSNIVRTEEEMDPLRRRPIMGYIRKRIDKSIEKKVTKPPWLKNDPSESEQCIKMREQIFNQIQKLRKRKINESPLVDIVHPIPKAYPKRVCKNLDIPEISGPKLGIKIVDVRGGIDDEAKNEIIQQKVLSPGIKLTKTQDITKIKGWRRKKLLVNNEDTKEPLPTIKSNEPNLVINIPVTNKKPEAVESMASCSYPMDAKPVKNQQDIEDIALNVFASNNLEGFLTQQKTLNISYDVPNLESSNHTIDYLDSTVLITEPQEEKLVGEKKRIYSLAETEECNTLRQNSKTDTSKPRTLAEKRKLLEQSEGTLKKEIEEDSMIYSNIYYKGKKLTIPTRFKKAIYIGSNLHKSKKQYKYVQIDGKRGRKRKLSILNSQPIVKPEISYKPGPLCRKQYLQKTGFGKWEAVLKKLPKLTVEVFPKIGKPIHPKVVPFVKFETFEISEERADFALSALLGNPDDKIFTFDVNYEREQENILMRRKIIEEVKSETNHYEPSKKVFKEDLDGVVGQVIDDLITCIENSEIQNDIIKDDPDFTPYVQDSSTPVKYKEKKTKTEVIKGTARRTNLELKRLNVKVIEVNIEDDQKPLDECTKPFCKLGCVCSSLNKTTLPSDHCGNYHCIFKCKCVKKNDTLKFVLPPGTDILSERTVSRLQDEAKKDLAKVEKEFTQTVIHANNKTIVFSDTKDRKRRSLKFPKRYKDYVETNLLDEDKYDEPIRQVVPVPVLVKKSIPKMTPCFVKLHKLNLDHVIPYCWVHNMYDCDCNCTALPVKNKSEPTEPKVEETNNLVMEQVKKMEEIRERVKKLKAKPIHCARTKGLSTSFYLERNRVGLFKRRIAKKLLAEKSGDTVLLYKWYNMDTYSDQLSSNDAESDPSTEPISINIVESKPNRRKQVLIARDEIGQHAEELQVQTCEPAIQRRKKQKAVLNKSDVPEMLEDMFQNSTGVYKPSDLVGEKFNQLLGMSNDKESEYRLLQWSTLLARYEAHVWDIWTARTDSKARFVITNSNVKLVNGFINIRTFASVADKESIKTDFIRCIITQTPPSTNEPENTLLILKKNYKLWEVCGMCAKNTNKKDENTEGTDEEHKLSIKESTNTNSVALKNSLFSTKIPFSSNEYFMKELAPLIKTNDDSRNILNPDKSRKITAALPHIQENCCWRVLKVNSTFNVLSFTRNQVRIKCSELITMTKHAQRETKTLIINRASESYNHKLFGIYISHNQPDKIFIGPYFDYETHDFETLRFLNNKLVSTEEFSKMTGQTINAPTGTWYKQTMSEDKPTVGSNGVIDLTENEEATVQTNSLLAEVENDNTSKENANLLKICTKYKKILPLEPHMIEKEVKNVVSGNSQTKSPRSLLKLNHFPNINARAFTSEKKTTASIEKIYLMRLKTLMRNVSLPLPSGTYPVCFKVNFSNDIIHGFKYISGEKIGVYFWPGSNQARLFQNATEATEWLQNRFNKLFVVIPNTFQILVQLVEYSGYLDSMLHNKKTMLIATYCDDVYIAGEFGVIKMKDLVTLMMEDYEFKPKKPKDLKFRLENNALEYRKMVIRFLKANDIADSGFARPLILQMVGQLETLLNIEQKQKSAMENLQKMKTVLQARYDTLKAEKDGLNVTPQPDVICLDSDEELSNPLSGSVPIQETLNTSLVIEPLPTKKLQSDSNSASEPELTITRIESLETDEINTISSGESSSANVINSTNTSEDPLTTTAVVEPVNATLDSLSTSNVNEDSIRQFINIANLNETPSIKVMENSLHLNVNTLKCKLESSAPQSTKNIVLTLLKPKVLKTSNDKVKIPKNLPVTKLLMIPNKSVLKSVDSIERIDLSNFSTNSVSSMLGANLNNTKVMLTKAQLNNLKAISEKSKFKRVFLNKIDCDKEASALEDPLSTT